MDHALSRTIEERSPQAVRLVLFHAFDLRIDGDTLPVPLSSQKVLAFLALHDRALPRAFVAGALWPETSEERAAANLRSALWRLHRAGCVIVEGGRDRLRLAPSVAADVWDMMNTARVLLQDSARMSDLALARASTDASRWGELLPGWFDDWLIVERERLRQIRLHALEALAERLISAGQLGPAVEIALSAVEEEPLRESAQRVLIRAHLSEGNVGEAIRQYRTYRHLLAEELGVVPSLALEELVPPLSVR